MLAKGKVSLCHLKRGGPWPRSPIWSDDNLIVNQASDIFPKIMSGELSIRYIYMQFKNGSPTLPTPALDDKITLYPALPSDEDYLRVPILSTAFVDQNGDGYDHNRVIFNAASDAAGTTGEANGLTFTDGTSQVFSLGLVASSGSKSSDLLFSRVALGAAVTKQAGFNLVAHWGITFTSS